MISEAWVDRVLILAASGLFAFLIVLGAVRVWRAFSHDGRNGRPH